MIYLDTSAFIKLYFIENGSELVERCVTIQDEPLPVWEIQEAEFINACRLKAFWGDITPEQADGHVELFSQRLRRGQYYVPEVDRHALMDTFRRLSRQTPKLGCRTMDILHVALALQLAPRQFLTFDDRQRALATHAGLTVLPSKEVTVPAHGTVGLDPLPAESAQQAQKRFLDRRGPAL